MIRSIKSLLLIFGFWGGVSGMAWSQNKVQAPDDNTYKPLILKLNDSGSKYIRFMTWHQVWVSATQNNPGTLGAEGQSIGGQWTTDLAIRRSRFMTYAQMGSRFLIMTHWGINNQSFINGGAANQVAGVVAPVSNLGKKPQMFIHDAYTDYAIIPTKWHIGAGLHYWNGVSRLSSASTTTFMTLDIPVFNFYNIETTDQFARQFGVFTKGQIGRFDYRFALNQPFVYGLSASPVGSNLTAQARGTETAVNVINEKKAWQGYVNYMFWDKETNVLPTFTGTYLGTKKVLNLGAGFYTQPKATATRTAQVATADSIRRYRETILGADFFLDMPIGMAKKQCLNVLLTYYNMDFGPRYLRNLGILNEHINSTSTNDSWAGGGNAQPTIGTGQIFYAQVGYALPKNKKGQQFMPYATYTHKDFDRLTHASDQFAYGLNWFIAGHNAKITAEYATRPIYHTVANALQSAGHAGQLTIQSQVFL